MKKSALRLFILLMILTALAAIFLYNFHGNIYNFATEFKTGFKIGFNDASGYNDRGIKNEEVSKFGLAADDYLKAIELDPNGKTGKAAYSSLMNLSEKLKNIKRPQPPPDQSEQLFLVGINYFDAAVPLFKKGDFAGAKRSLEMALQIFTTARMLNPDNRHIHGWMYMAKGFIYYLCGFETIKFVKSTDTNYVVMIYLRRAYYPSFLADAYYKLALEYLTEPAYKNLIKGYQDANDYYFNIAKKFLPQVDYWAKSYMANVQQEAKCVIQMDKTNELLVSGKHEEACKALVDFEKEILKLSDNESANKNGFYFLNMAYARIASIMPILLKKGNLTNEQKTLADKYLNECLSDLKRARFAFKNTAYIGSCDSLERYVSQLKNEYFPA